MNNLVLHNPQGLLIAIKNQPINRRPKWFTDRLVAPHQDGTKSLVSKQRKRT